MAGIRSPKLALPRVAATLLLLLAPCAARAQQLLTFPVASTSGGWGTGGCNTATERGTSSSGAQLVVAWTDTTGASSATVRVEANWKFFCSGGAYNVAINGTNLGGGSVPGANCGCNGSPFAATSQTFSTGFSIVPRGSNSLTFTSIGSGWIGLMDSTWALRITVTPNNVAPTLASPAPANNSYRNASAVTFSATVSAPEAGQSAAAEFFIGGSWIAGSSVTTSGTSSLTRTLADGTYSWSVRAHDALGLVSGTSGPYTPVVDTLRPTVPATAVVAPNGGEALAGGSAYTIRWSGISDANLGTAPISLYLSTDGGATWPTTLATGLANSGSFAWTVNALNTTNARIKVRATDLAGNLAEDASDASFTIDSTMPTQPGAPAGVPNPCDGASTIAWSAATDSGGSGLAGYRLERSADAGSTWTQIATTAAAGFDDSGLSQGSYVYRSRAFDRAGNLGSWSAVSAPLVVDTTQPSAPGAPTVSPNPSAGSAALAWSTVIDLGGSGLAGYRLERSRDEGSTWTEIAAPGSAAWSDSGLAQGSYVYRVRAVDYAGNLGAYSGLAATPIVDTTAPPAPGAPSASPNPSAGSATLAWSPVTDSGGSGLAGYRLERSDDAGSSWTQIATPVAASFDDSGLAEGGHLYRVRAVDRAGNLGAWSAVSAPLVVDTTAPPAPGAPSASPNPASGSATVAWGAVTDSGGSGLAGYRLERSADAGSTWTQIATLVATSFDEFGLAQGTFVYRVRAVDRAGNLGSWSVVSAPLINDTTPPPAPGAPVLNPSMCSGSVMLSWSPVSDTGGSGLTGYRLERSADAGSTWMQVGTPGAASFSDSGIPQGLYRYRVRAIDGAGNVGGWSALSAQLLVDTTAPSQLDAPVAAPNPSDGTTSLTWLMATDQGGSGLSGYVLERSADGGANWAQLTAQPSTRFTDSGLAEGSYVYRVRAFDNVGNLGTWSAGSAPLIVDLTAPSAPGTPVATPNPSSGSASVTWAAATDSGGSGLEGYRVQRSADAGANWSDVASQAGTTLAQPGLAQGRYLYRVAAADRAGNLGPFSAPSAALIVDTTAPSMPGTPVASPSVTGGATALSWAASADNGGSGLAGYTLEVSTDRATWASLATTVSASYSYTPLPGTYFYRVRARDNAGNASAPSSASSALLAYPTLVVSGLGSPRTAGEPGTITVEAVDAFGNRYPGYRGTVRFGSTDRSARLPDNYAFGEADSGIATFPVTLFGAGSWSITATDVALAQTTGSQVGIVVEAGSASSFLLSGVSSPRTAGDPSDVTIEALDEWGNTAVAHTGAVVFTSTDPQATLPTACAFTADGHGLTVCPGLLLKTAGVISVSAADASSPSISGTLGGIEVRHAAPAQLLASGIGSPQTAGVPATLTVEVRDRFGNPATTYAGTIAFSSSDPRAQLPASYGFGGADMGVKVFEDGVAFETAGTQSIHVEDPIAGLSADVSDIEVLPAAAAELRISGIGSPRVAGEAAAASVELLDAFGNRATGYAGTVRLSSTDPQAVLPAEHTFTPGDAGRAELALTLETAGTQSATASDVDNSSLTGTQADIEVRAAGAVRLAVEGLADPTTAGQPATLVVRALDSFDNVDHAFAGTISFASSDQRAVLPSQTTFMPADAGEKTFADVVLLTAGAQQVSASESSTGIAGAQSVTVVPAAAHRVAIEGPDTGVAGESLAFALQVLDQFDNPVPAAQALEVTLRDMASAVVEATSLSGASVGGPSAAGATDLQGAASLRLRSTAAGTLRLCVTGSGLTAPESCHAITYSAAAADHVALATATPHLVAGGAAEVALQVRDGFGNPVGAEVAVALSVDGSATFDGAGASLEVTTAADGQARAQVRDQVAEAVTVRVDSALAAGAPLPASLPNETLALTFGAGVADHVALAAPASAVAGQPAQVLLQIVDQSGNPTAGIVAVCVSVSGADGGSPTIEAAQLEGAQPAPGRICGTTSELGSAEVRVADAKAEQVSLVSASTGLPGSGSADASASIEVVPAAPERLRLTAASPSALACGSVDVDIQLTDAFDNAVTDPALAQVEVTLTASAPAGSAQITSTTLAGAGTLPAGSVTGRLDAGGTATVAVTLDARAQLTVAWSSTELPGDPSQTSPAVVDFGPGAPFADRSTVSASGTQVEAGWGSVRLEAIPVDACGVRLGAGRAVELSASFGTVSQVTDNGDGTYTATFQTAQGECPASPATIQALLDGAPFGGVEVVAVCSVVDPGSPVAPLTAQVDACASSDVFATIAVTPMGASGLPMPPGQQVTVDGEAPLLISSVASTTTDPQSGATTYTLQVGSNRCGAERPVPIRVNGVLLAAEPKISFACMPAASAEVVAEPASAPADGQSAIVATVRVIDSCGNPAFGRVTTLGLLDSELGATVNPAEATTADSLGQPDDGAARFSITSEKAGVTGIQVVADAVQLASETRLTFSLAEVLDVAWSASAPQAEAGQALSLTAKLTSRYAGKLVEIRLTPSLEGLSVESVSGATDAGDGSYLVEQLDSKGEADVSFSVRVGEGIEAAHAGLAVAYGAEGTADRLETQATRVDVAVIKPAASASEDSGCGCATGTGAEPLAVIAGLLALASLRRRRA